MLGHGESPVPLLHSRLLEGPKFMGAAQSQKPTCTGVNPRPPPHTNTQALAHTRAPCFNTGPSPGLYRSLQSGILCFPQRQPSGTNLGPSERAVFPDVGWRSSSRLIPKSPVLTSSYVCSCGEWFLPLTSQSHWRVGVEGRYLDVPDPVSQTVPKHRGHTYSVAWEADLGPD